MTVSDEALIEKFRGGDKSAVDEILSRYKNTVRSIAHKFFLSDWDKEDLVQEGMCGLYSAILNFRGDREFFPYAYACIKNRIIDAIKKSVGKNGISGYAAPLGEEEVCPSSPEEELIDSESLKEFSSGIKAVLSPLEYRAITMYTDGATMTEISDALGKTYKQTDNALSRAKRKLRELFDKRADR